MMLKASDVPSGVTIQPTSFFYYLCIDDCCHCCCSCHTILLYVYCHAVIDLTCILLSMFTHYTFVIIVV